MSRTLLDLVRELNTLNDDNLAERVIANNDVQWCLSELQDILETELPTLTPPNEPLTLEELREMGGQPYWHVGLREESPPPHWNILDPFCAKRIEDYKYGENWIAYRRPPEGEANA